MERLRYLQPPPPQTRLRQAALRRLQRRDPARQHHLLRGVHRRNPQKRGPCPPHRPAPAGQPPAPSSPVPAPDTTPPSGAFPAATDRSGSSAPSTDSTRALLANTAAIAPSAARRPIICPRAATSRSPASSVNT